jgi:hypothetical protein
MPQNSAAVPGRPFVKGKSGNPGGRPKGLARSARELVGENGRALADFWFEVLQDTDAKMADRLEASRLLADRGWGKAPSFMPIEEEDPLGLTGAHARLAEKLVRVLPLHDAKDETEGAT